MKQKNNSVAIDPMVVALNSKAVKQLVETKTVSRIFIPVVSEGNVVYPTGVYPYRQMEKQEGVDNIFAEFISLCDANNIEVVGIFDLMKVGNFVSNARFVKEFPDLLELTSNGDFGNAISGQYYNMFHEKVKDNLKKLIDELVDIYKIKHLCFKFELNSNRFFGFSSLTREMSVRKIQIDPVDITFASPVETQLLTEKISNWRLDESREFMRYLCNYVSNKSKNVKISIYSDPNMYRYALRVRGRSLNDWISWVKFPGVSGLVFNAFDNFDGKYLEEILKKIKTPEKPSMLKLFDRRKGNEEVNQESSWRNVVYLKTETDVSVFAQILEKEKSNENG